MLPNLLIAQITTMSFAGTFGAGGEKMFQLSFFLLFFSKLTVMRILKFFCHLEIKLGDFSLYSPF